MLLRRECTHASLAILACRDLDETLIIFNSLLNGEYPAALAKAARHSSAAAADTQPSHGGKKGRSSTSSKGAAAPPPVAAHVDAAAAKALGEHLADRIFDFCDQFFHYRQVKSGQLAAQPGGRALGTPLHGSLRPLPATFVLHARPASLAPPQVEHLDPMHISDVAPNGAHASSPALAATRATLGGAGYATAARPSADGTAPSAPPPPQSPQEAFAPRLPSDASPPASGTHLTLSNHPSSSTPTSATTPPASQTHAAAAHAPNGSQGAHHHHHHQGAAGGGESAPVPIPVPLLARPSLKRTTADVLMDRADITPTAHHHGPPSSLTAHTPPHSQQQQQQPGATPPRSLPRSNPPLLARRSISGTRCVHAVLRSHCRRSSARGLAPGSP